MMSSLFCGLCLAALIMAADVMGHGGNGLSDFETDNPPLAELGSEEGVDVGAPADKEEVEDGETPTHNLYKDYPHPLFADAHYESAAEAEKEEIIGDAEKLQEHLVNNQFIELPAGVSLPKGEAARKAASTLHEDLQHTVHSAVLYGKAPNHSGKEETQGHYKTNIAKLVGDHGLGAYEHLKAHKQEDNHDHQGPATVQGATHPHNGHDQHLGASDRGATHPHNGHDQHHAANGGSKHGGPPSPKPKPEAKTKSKTSH